MDQIQSIILQLEANIPNYQKINTSISNASVGWHIEHALLTINMIVDAMKKSDPNKYKWEFKISKLIIFTLNKIPKGKAQAPKVVRPIEGYNEESLKSHIDKTLSNLNEIKSLNKNSYFEHPFFGKLNTKPTIKFFKIHTNHHLKIIQQIVNSI